MSGSEPIALAWCGPADHGICVLAKQISDRMGRQGFAGSSIWEPDPARLGELADRIPDGTRLLHLHANDWLFRDPATDGGARVAAFASAVARRGVAMTVTLHDLPQPGDLFARRAASYAAISAAARGIVVQSEHERGLLIDALAAADPIARSPEIAVIPLPVDAPRSGSRRSTPLVEPRTVGIFGFIYPGKGHREVIDELAGIGPGITVVAGGRPSDGHEHLVTDLAAAAQQHGVRFRVTGHIADDELGQWLRGIDVPVAPATGISASGSINSWLGAGRRPLAAAGPYTRELEARSPGSLRLYAPGRLRTMVEEALADRGSTLLPAGLELHPTGAEVAAAYLGWLRVRAGAVC